MSTLVMLPDEAEILGAVFRLADGQEYMVGPAIYKVTRTETPVQSVLGELPTGTPMFHPDYIPPEQWPAGVELDGGQMARFSKPLDTVERDDVRPEGPEIGPGPGRA